MGSGRGRERGQATVETAVAMAVVIPLLAFALQTAWSLHCGHALDAAVEHARFSATPSDAAEGDAAAETIRRLMVEASPELAAGELEVADASISYRASRPDKTEDLPDSDFEDYRIATKSDGGGSVAVAATVTYEPPRLLAVGAHPTWTRVIDSSRAYDATFEVW